MITIYYAGYDAIHTADFVYDVPEGHNTWLLLLTRTPAQFWVEGEMKEYPANCAVVFQPHQKILYRACADSYGNDWIHFDSDEIHLKESKLLHGVPFPMPDPEYFHQLFQLLTAEHFFSCAYRELSMDYLFRIIINKLIEASHSTNNTPHYQNLLNLRKAIYNSPGHSWAVPAMAEHVHLSPGYLQAIYKSTFGISCMDDVIQCRIRLAKEKLLHSPHRISEIAAICGYMNIEHFSRQFRQITGYAPREYQKLMASDS
ncbi:AraC family transcriptional regulator [Paenibacillus sp. FSL L8-0436]|uniref:helix-turn-helix transcriptional regulator n=1 Tax=Paenibacillus sp. FSL L8-0436 TaxID=2954686 RepID=UPI0031591F8E